MDTLTEQERWIMNIFEPDSLLPEQFYGTFKVKQLEPERRLMLAVLEDAVACFQKYLLAEYERGQALFREAEEWLMDSQSDRPYSCQGICEVLDITPAYLRQGLRRWKEERLAGKNLKPRYARHYNDSGRRKIA